MTQITTAAYQPIDREAVWAALFAWFKSEIGSSFKAMGRKHIAPPELAIADQPAFFLVATRERHIPNQKPGLPTKLLLRGYLIVYLFDDSPCEDIGTETVLAETALNGFLQQIDSALVPDDPSTGKFTLGGLVTHCWIEGDSDLDPGIFGPQCAAILPLFILV